MKYFSMPSDFKKETIDKYDALNKEYKDSRVVETYGNITLGNTMESGRAVSQLPEVDLMDMQEFIAYSAKKKIEFNYTLNSPHIGNREFTPEGVREIRSFFKSLYEAGVRNMTIALPTLFEIAANMEYDFKIKASTLCQVTNANKARAYKEMGVERIVVDESIVRDFGTLKKIVHVFGDKVEIIINPLCHQDCIYRTFHYNQIGGDSVGEANETGVNFYEHRCVMQRYRRISDLLRLCWVRPEDIRHYTEIGINYFKLQGRQVVHTGDVEKTLRAYFDEKFDGDLMELLNMFYSLNQFKIPLDNEKLDGFIKPFVEKEGFCRRECGTCGYCDRFAEKVIDYKKAAEVKDMAEVFYSDYDKFTTMNEPGKSESVTEEQHPEIDADFDI
ncbi:MAG: hypothetical protein GY757_11985 [bacterium]|nr:hypothetical protein [bacterium]